MTVKGVLFAFLFPAVALCIVVALLAYRAGVSAAHDGVVHETKEPAVQCICTCPEPKCTGGDGIVADGYNVNITLDGTKWHPPALNPEEEDYVTLCRRESRDLIHHPDLTLTTCYQFLHECHDDLYEVRSGFDDEANQTCWQQQAF